MYTDNFTPLDKSLRECCQAFGMMNEGRQRRVWGSKTCRYHSKFPGRKDIGVL